MNWTAVPVAPEKVTAEALYELGHKHRLVPENTDLAIEYFRSMSQNCAMVKITDGDQEIATVIFSDIMDGETAMVDLVPNAKYFSPVDEKGSQIENPCYEQTREVLKPILDKLMGARDLRRITSMIPKSRSRTMKALRECGFKKEGVMRKGVQLKGHQPEDLVIMGMLRAKE